MLSRVIENNCLSIRQMQMYIILHDGILAICKIMLICDPFISNLCYLRDNLHLWKLTILIRRASLSMVHKHCRNSGYGLDANPVNIVKQSI